MRLRVNLTITCATPELLDDLGKLPVQQRAQRLRELALVGLAVLGTPSSPSRDTAVSADTPAHHPSNKAAARLAGRLLNSV